MGRDTKSHFTVVCIQGKNVWLFVSQSATLIIAQNSATIQKKIDPFDYIKN